MVSKSINKLSLVGMQLPDNLLAGVGKLLAVQTKGLRSKRRNSNIFSSSSSLLYGRSRILTAVIVSIYSILYVRRNSDSTEFRLSIE